MFLSLLQFLFVARSEAVIVNEYEWNSLLEDLLEKVKRSFFYYYYLHKKITYVIILSSMRLEIAFLCKKNKKQSGLSLLQTLKDE